MRGADIGAVLQGVGAFGLLIVAVVYARRYEHRLRHSELRERQARAEVAMNVDIETEVVLFVAADDRRCWIIETRVRLENVGNENWCVPAIYVAARSMSPESQSNGAAGDEEASAPTLTPPFESLPSCGDLSVPINVAASATTVYQVGPGEIERFARRDVLDADGLVERLGNRRFTGWASRRYGY